MIRGEIRPPRELGGDQAQVFQRHPVIELALPGLAGGEGVGQLLHPQRLALRGDDVEQDLEARRLQLVGHPVDRLAPDHEEAADRIGHVGLQRLPAERSGELAGGLAGRREALSPGRRRRGSGCRPRGRRRRRAARPACAAAGSRRAACRRRSPPRTARRWPARPRSPRRPDRGGRRGAGSARAGRGWRSASPASAVPSGELSSTKITSQATPASAASSFSTSRSTLERSLKVGRDHGQLGAVPAGGLADRRRGQGGLFAQGCVLIAGLHTPLLPTRQASISPQARRWFTADD